MFYQFFISSVKFNSLIGPNYILLPLYSSFNLSRFPPCQIPASILSRLFFQNPCIPFHPLAEGQWLFPWIGNMVWHPMWRWVSSKIHEVLYILLSTFPDSILSYSFVNLFQIVLPVSMHSIPSTGCRPMAHWLFPWIENMVWHPMWRWVSSKIHEECLTISHIPTTGKTCIQAEGRQISYIYIL